MSGDIQWSSDAIVPSDSNSAFQSSDIIHCQMSLCGVFHILFFLSQSCTVLICFHFLKTHDP